MFLYYVSKCTLRFRLHVSYFLSRYNYLFHLLLFFQIERGVVYINVDCAVAGPILGASASPTIKHKLLEAAKSVPFFNDTYASYYDFWKEHKKPQEPQVWTPGSGSDHASFIFYAGVPIIGSNHLLPLNSKFIILLQI